MRRALLPLGELTVRQTAGLDPLVGGTGCITWHSTYETTGAAVASYLLNDGPVANGQVLAYVTLSAGESTRDFIGLHALAFTEGLYYKSETGSVGGSVLAWVDHYCERWLVEAHLAFALMDEAALAAAAAVP